MSGSETIPGLSGRLVTAAGGNPHLAANVLTTLARSLFENHPVKETLLALAGETRLGPPADLSPFEYVRGIAASCVREAVWNQTLDGDLAGRIAEDAARTIIAGLSPKVTDAALDLCVGFLRENPGWLAGVVEEGEKP